jgi:ketosteroid isomerase-like protein
MLSQQDISDRLEIQQLMVDYANAIDRRDWDALDNVFTPDAYIDYRKMGGVDGKYPEIKKWLVSALAQFPNYYHFVGNVDMKVKGDTAVTRTACFNPMEVKMGEGKSQIMFLGLWYVDKLVRTPKGWRMAERVEEACFNHNAPSTVKVTD